MNTTTPHEMEHLLSHGQWLRRLASSLVVADGDAEDLVQETWLAALVRGPGRREESRAWLARVLRNKASTRWRKLDSREHREASTARAESLPSTEELASRADLSRQLVGYVLDLPTDTQRILLARYFEGLSSTDIARRLGQPAATVRSQLKRGLDQLRVRLDAENEGERERWLSALTPLIGTATKWAGLGAVLAASTGLRIAIGVVVALFATGAWWMTREPALPTPPIVVFDDEEPGDLAEVEAPAPIPEPTLTDVTEERVAVQAAPEVEASPIHGQLVHPSLGEAVVWYELGILPSASASVFDMEITATTVIPDPEDMELVRTDASGRFRTEGKYESGDYTIVFMEDWRLSRIPVDLDRIRQPREMQTIEHDALASEPLNIEISTGPVFAIDCPKAIELGAENMVAIYSHIDHFPPGYYRPARLQTDPVPFVRMQTDTVSSYRNQVTNMRLVSADGFWSGSIGMEIPKSIATEHVSFELESRSLVEVALDFGPRKPPFYLEMHYWEGSVDPTAANAPDPDIIELQAKFDGTDLDAAIVKYVPPGLATIGIKANTCEYWYRVVELTPGHNAMKAEVQPDSAATGVIEGRLVYLSETPPVQPVRAIVNAQLNGAPTFQTLELEFVQESNLWVAEFRFTHLPVMAHTIWFDKGGPTTHDPKEFAVEPDRIQIEVNGPPAEFELITDLTTTPLQVRVRDAVTGDKVKEFHVSVIVPGAWVRSRKAESKSGRARMKLLGDLEGGLVSLSAKGYVRRDLNLSEAESSSRGLKLEVELMPGWGGPVYAKHADTEAPLEGVRLLLDGVEVGVTDENGEFDLIVDTRPKRAEFLLDGYEVIRQGGMVDKTGEIISVGPDPIRQYLGVRLREK